MFQHPLASLAVAPELTRTVLELNVCFAIVVAKSAKALRQHVLPVILPLHLAPPTCTTIIARAPVLPDIIPTLVLKSAVNASVPVKLAQVAVQVVILAWIIPSYSITIANLPVVMAITLIPPVGKLNLVLQIVSLVAL